MIEVQGATKVFYRGSQQIHALSNVSLSVGSGETLAIRGPSGSGKTTALTLIGTLDKPTSGTIRLAGTDPWTLSDRLRSRLRATTIGFVFQNYNLIPQLAAWRNVALPLRYAGIRRRERRRRAMDALAVVGLSDRVDHLPAQLSGGEEQRVAIARSMVANPKLLLADEPTGNLDTTTGEGVMEQLLSLNASGATLVIVTHNADVAAHCHRQLHLLDGAIQHPKDAS